MLQRNIPELAASLGGKGTNQIPGAFPLVNERPVIERPSWEPLTRFEVEKELVMLRSRDKTLGGTLAWVVDTLLQDEGGVRDTERMKLRKREALEVLSYVRDVLMTNSIELEVDRLMATEEPENKTLKAREREGLEGGRTAVVLNPPIRASLADSHSRLSAKRQQGQSETLSNQAPFRIVVPKSNSESTKVLWGSTQSSIPSGVIPRLPPQSSTTFKRGKADKSTLKNEDYLDPLGALR